MHSLRSTLSRHFASTTSRRSPTPLPWFVDKPAQQSPLPSHLQSSTTPPIPLDAPEVIKHLHSQLLKSPLLDKSHLVVSSAVLPDPGPPLPLKKPQGRRKKGGTYAGESEYEAVSGGLWSWVIMSQVKEGTESRGAIESVVRLVRKTLLQHNPPVFLPPKSRRKNGSEWYMVDAGNFAVHILSKSARERYFTKIADCQSPPNNLLDIFKGIAQMSPQVDDLTTPVTGEGTGIESTNIEPLRLPDN